MLIDKNLAGQIGEFYTWCELCRVGFKNVYLANNSGQEGWDIIIYPSDRGNPVKIQTKVVQWESETNKTINGNFVGDFNILIIIILNYSEDDPYISLVIPKSHIKQRPKGLPRGLIDQSDGNLLFTKRTITLSTYENEEIKKIIDDKYRNHWNHIWKALI